MGGSCQSSQLCGTSQPCIPILPIPRTNGSDSHPCPEGHEGQIHALEPVSPALSPALLSAE